MVNGEQQDTFFVGESEQAGPYQRAVDQVEGSLCLFVHGAVQFGFSLRRRRSLQVGDGQLYGQAWGDTLIGKLVLKTSWRRTISLMLHSRAPTLSRPHSRMPCGGL